MTLDELLARFPEEPKHSGASWKALCPAHPDNNPSLSITQRDGKILLKCHAACATETICERLGIKLSDLTVNSNGHKKQGAEELGPVVAEYNYTDEAGRLLYQVVRFEPKDFRQRRPNGKGGWTWSLGDTRKVLYRLPDVIAADEVFILEGEKDCETARKLSLVATCNPMGAGKWLGAYGESLRGKRVVVIADADSAGRKHAKQVAQSLAGKVESLKLLEMPDGMKDLTEAVERGFDRKLLEALVADAKEWESDELLDLGKVTDAVNADMLVRAEGENLRYVHEMKKWMPWDGRRWKIDEGQRARALMEKTMRAYIAKVAETGSAKDVEAAADCLNTKRITNGLGEAEKKLGVAANELDSHPFLVTFQNGTLDLRTMTLTPHQREHLITKMVHHNYVPDAECPRFLSFLEHAVGADAIPYVQKLLGYSLTGDTSEKTFVVVWGVGDTGKTTFLEIARKLLEEYAVLLQVDTLMDRRGGDGSTQEDLASLRGTRLATTSELDQGRKLSIATLKRVVQGQGKITACAKWQKKITFDETHKLWFDTNHLPKIPADEQAVWNRVAVVVFSNPVLKKDQDKNLAARLLHEESEGILAWMVKGEELRRQDKGFGKVPDSFEAEKKKWQKRMDVVQEFIDDCCVTDSKARAKADDIYKAYVAWSGNPDYALSHRAFTQRLAKISITLDAGKRSYQGVALVKEEPEKGEEKLPFKEPKS